MLYNYVQVRSLLSSYSLYQCCCHGIVAFIMLLSCYLYSYHGVDYFIDVHCDSGTCAAIVVSVVVDIYYYLLYDVIHLPCFTVRCVDIGCHVDVSNYDVYTVCVGVGYIHTTFVCPI